MLDENVQGLQAIAEMDQVITNTRLKKKQIGSAEKLTSTPLTIEQKANLIDQIDINNFTEILRTALLEAVTTNLDGIEEERLTTIINGVREKLGLFYLARKINPTLNLDKLDAVIKQLSAEKPDIIVRILAGDKQIVQTA